MSGELFEIKYYGTYESLIYDHLPNGPTYRAKISQTEIALTLEDAMLRISDRARIANFDILKQSNEYEDDFEYYNDIENFIPEYVKIIDGKNQLAIGATLKMFLKDSVANFSLEWQKPEYEKEKRIMIESVAKELISKASYERGWDNQGTAENLERKADINKLTLAAPEYQGSIAQILWKLANIK